MTFDAVDFLAGLFAPAASPGFDPDADGGPVELPVAAVRAVDAERLDLRRELAGIIRELRRNGDRDRDRDIREAYAERAAIMQFDGGLPRREAEGAAAADVLAGLRADPDFDIRRAILFAECNRRMRAATGESNHAS